MATTSIPKTRLINLILNVLKAKNQALAYFNISSDSDIEERLESFTKDQLLTFIVQLGEYGEAQLKSLETSFPLRRPPTLYVTIIENKASLNKDVIGKYFALAEVGQKEGMRFGDNDTIRFIYLPQGGVSRFLLNRFTVIEFQIHYERRIEYIEADPERNYGQPSNIYSLETAFVWLPLTKYNHAIIACSDYPALRRIRSFMQIKLGIDLNPPWLNKEMLEKITHGSVPRSVTYSLNAFAIDETEPQSITIADPDLQDKPFFKSLVKSDREQVSGFYTAHPGLALGGIGIARRDGKVWTPRKLDRKEILALSIAIIEQTESELAKVSDVSILLKYYHSNRVKVGDFTLHGQAKEVWRKLALQILETIKNKRRETDISPSMIYMLVKYQRQLRLLTTIKYDCPNCGLKWLAKCPDCHEPLMLNYDSDLCPTCPKCKKDFIELMYCTECGAEFEVGEIIKNVNIQPERELNESIKGIADKSHIDYSGLWMIDGLSLLWIAGKKKPKHPVLYLSDFLLWRKRAKINSPINSSLAPSTALKVLGKTLEKCERDGAKASTEKCEECMKNPINPDWIKYGDTCLLRLFGLPIDKKFDGIHHKHEVADLRYQDTILRENRLVNIGIHVKSRNLHCPPEGMGLSKYQIQGLYKQVVFSVFQSAVLGENLHVIGIAIPNKIREEVIDSLSYAVNNLGFSFLAIDEKDWLNVIRLAFEQAVFDFRKATKKISK